MGVFRSVLGNATRLFSAEASPSWAEAGKRVGNSPIGPDTTARVVKTTKPRAKPKLDPFIAIIDAFLKTDAEAPPPVATSTRRPQKKPFE